MDSDEKIIEDAVQKTMLEMEQRAPIQMHRLKQNGAELQEVLFAARKAATEEVKMAKDFAGQPSNILEILMKHLPDERVKMIKEGLSHPTYRMEISKMADGHYSVSFNRDGKTFLPPRDLTSALDIDWATIMQYASIVVEAVLLVLSAVGISASPSAGTIEKTAEDVAQTLKNSSAFEKAVESFVKAWKASGSSATAKAKALFYLLKDTYAAGVLWTTIKSLCSNMSTLEWAETAAKVTAMIIAAFATEGAALIAKIALIILSAVDFAKKLANLEKLEEAKSALN